MGVHAKIEQARESSWTSACTRTSVATTVSTNAPMQVKVRVVGVR